MTTAHGTPVDNLRRIRTLYNRRVPMRDGVELAADVYMPAEGGPFPALVLRTPYDKLASDDLQLRSAIVHLAQGEAPYYLMGRAQILAYGEYRILRKAGLLQYSNHIVKVAAVL